MYRLGHQIKRHYWPYICIGCFVVACIVIAAIYMPRLFSAHTSLVQSVSVTEHISASDTTTQHVAEPTFSMDIPSGWRSALLTQASYSWMGTSPDGAGRRLDIYIDQVPATMAVNRLLPVQAMGNKIAVSGTVSDNCVNFTDKATASLTTGTAPAKWDNVNFICDVGNYERDVVAIGSSASVNNVTITGQHVGTHHVLILYTDNSINPDFSVFTAIIQSFQML